MMEYNYIEKSQKILNNVQLGFEFEFYSDLKPKTIALKIQELINKNIRIGVKNFGGKDKIGYHTGFTPTADTFKLEKDFSGGPKMYELITGVLNYFEAKQILISMLKWIDEFGYTNEYSSLHLNISFDTKSNYRLDCRNIDIMKFCLGYDEEMIYKHFPERRKNVYCKEISTFYPKYNYHRSVFTPNIDGTNFNLPNDNKYYGVNFLKRENGYLEYRYIGGKDYQKRIPGIIEILDYNILYLYSTLSYPVLTSGEHEKYNTMVSSYKDKLDAFISIESFRVKFPEIMLLVDLKENLGVIKTFFENMKPMLYELVICNGMKKGWINYDTAMSRYQIKDAIIKNARNIKGLEIVSSKLTGHFNECSFYDCQLSVCNLEDCILYDYSEVDNSKLYDTIIKASVEVSNSFIKNNTYEISGKLTKCIVIGDPDVVSEIAVVDKKTMFVSTDYGKLGDDLMDKDKK